MDYSHILWDFNGTLLDDVTIGIESINALLRRRGLKPLESKEEYQKHFRFPIEDYYRSVGFDFDKDPYDLLAHEWVAEYRARERTAPLCQGAKEALEYIQSRALPQILFSATQKTMLCEQIEDLNIASYFTEILGSDNIYAEGKTALGVAWVQRAQPRRALLVGDTEHDADAAKAMGIDCVLIANGHRAAARLRATGCPVFPTLPAWLAHLKNTL